MTKIPKAADGGQRGATLAEALANLTQLVGEQEVRIASIQRVAVTTAIIDAFGAEDPLRYCDGFRRIALDAIDLDDPRAGLLRNQLEAVLARTETEVAKGRPSIA